MSQRFSLNDVITDGELIGRVVMLVKYSLCLDESAVRVEVVPSTQGRSPVDVMVGDSDASWRLATLVELDAYEQRLQLISS